MHKRLVFLSCLLLAGGRSAPAQQLSIRGQVLDPGERTLPGARIQCGPISVTTGLDGRFRIDGVAECAAQVSAPGFVTGQAALQAGRDAKIVLRVAGVSERLVVTATRRQTTAEQAGVAASVLTRQDLALRELPAVADILREVPGLQVAATGRRGHLTSVYTRGAQRTGTMFLIDGAPVNDPGGEYNLGHMSTGDIDRIEIVRGPESALFGAEAAAGVIQLFTRRGDPERKAPHGTFSLERGDFSTGQWRAGLTGGTGSRVDYSFHSEEFRTSGEYPNDGYRAVWGSANAGVRLSQATSLRGVLRVGDSVTGVPGQTAWGLIDHDARQTNRDSTLSLRLDDARSRDFVQQFTFSYHRIRDVYSDTRMDGPYELAALVRDASNPLPRTYLVSLLDPAGIPGVVPSGLRLVRQEVTLYPLLEPYLSATSRKRAGYQGAWSRNAATMAFGYEYERQEGDVSARQAARNNHGAFLHAQRAVGGRLFLAGGLRSERSSAFGWKLTPRGAAGVLVAREHGPLTSTFLRFSAGRGITEPSLIQNYARESYAVGNPDLRPERTASYEAGLVQEWFGRRVYTEVALFQNSFHDLITWVSLPAPVWGSWRNLESSRARGLEMAGRVRLADSIIFNASYTRLWTRVLSSTSPGSIFYGAGQELARRPGNSGAVSLSVSPRRWSFQAGAILVGERQDADYYLGVTRNPGYQNVYLAASCRLWPHLAPFLRADNLLNSRYQEVLGYSASSRSARGGLRVEW